MNTQFEVRETGARNSYPVFPLAQIALYLQSNLPVWYLDSDGVLLASNLLVFWIWGAISQTDKFLEANHLLGTNLFNVYSKPDNFERIVKPKYPYTASADFFRKKLSVARGLLAAEKITDERNIQAYYSFIDTVAYAAKHNSILQEIYQNTEPNQELEWSYSLRIHPPDTFSGQLEFEGTVIRVFDEGTLSGYVAIYRPFGQTISRIYAEYETLLKRFGEFSYVQYLNDEVKQRLNKVELQSLVDNSTTIRVQVNENPLTASNLAIILPALTSLYTKCWLIMHERFADLIEYTYTHNPRFEKEAPLIISRLTYNSPLDFKLDLSLEGLANAFRTIFEVIEKRGLARRKTEAEIEELEQKLRQQEQEFQTQQEHLDKMRLIEKQNAVIESQSKLIDLRTKQLGYIKDVSALSPKIIKALRPSLDETVLEIVTPTLYEDILKLDTSKGMKLISTSDQQSQSSFSQDQIN